MKIEHILLQFVGKYRREAGGERKGEGVEALERVAMPRGTAQQVHKCKQQTV